MAVTVVSNLSLWSAAEASTGWVSDSDSPAEYSGFHREGSGNLGAQISQETSHYYIPTGSGDAPGSSQNLSNTRVYAWVFVWGSLDTKANGGLRIVLGDGTNRVAYYVGGSDDYGFQVGGWTCIVLDTGNLPSGSEQLVGSSPPSLSAITQVGIGAKYLNKATGNVDNFYWDAIRFGLGITVYGGTSGDPGTFAEIAADDASTASGKAYGIIRELQAGVYGVQGNIIWGDSAGSNSFWFQDESAVVVIEDRVHGSGTPTDINLSVVANNTADPQHYELGVAVGSGDTQSGRNGVSFVNANPTGQPIVFDASDADLDELELYGCSFIGIFKAATLTPKFSADDTLGPNHVLSGITFARCGQVDIGDVPARNCIFSGYASTAAALLWTADIDIKNSQFLANTDSTNDPAAIEHDTAGTFGYDNLKFSSNDFDILNSVDATTADSYSDTNQDATQNLGDGTTVGVGQSFTNASAGVLSNVRFHLAKTGSPTGNLVAKLYALASAIGGGDDVPTGAALATSDPVSAAGLTGSLALTQFNFSDNFAMSASTDYFIAVEEDAGYSGDGSNHVDVGVDTSSPGHSGNMATDTGSWTASSGTDVVFFVSRGGYVIVQASNGADPGTFVNTGSPPGGTRIENGVTLTVTAKFGATAVAGARVRIERVSDGSLVTEGTTNGSGVFSDTFNFTGNLAVNVIVRLKGFKFFSASATIDAGGLSVAAPLQADPTVSLP